MLTRRQRYVAFCICVSIFCAAGDEPLKLQLEHFGREGRATGSVVMLSLWSVYLWLTGS